MIKITKNNKEDFNKTKEGKYYNDLKNKGYILLSISLLLLILFCIINTSELVEELMILLLFILSAPGAFLISFYYGKLYRYVMYK